MKFNINIQKRKITNKYPQKGKSVQAKNNILKIMKI